MPGSRLPFFNYTDEIKMFETLLNHGIWAKPFGIDKFWASHNTKEIFGWSGKEKIYSLAAIQEMTTEEEFDKLMTAFNQIEKDKKPEALILKVTVEKDSARHTRYIKMQLTVNKEPEGTFYILGTIHDITTQKKKEDEIAKAKDKAEQSDKIKTAFLTNLSYEIRNPMNTIIGFTELMNIAETSDEKKKEYSSLIIRRSRELLTLVDDIIELAKFDSGNISLSKTEFNLHKLLLETQDFFNKEKKNLNKDGIIVALDDFKSDASQILYSDAGRLQELLTILLNNALKYTEKGMVQFGYEITDKFVTIYVKDTGIGISKEEIKNIFQRFRQVEYTSTRKVPGAGLGLALAKSIVDLLGGKIWVESEQGNGATFSFTIPFVKPEKVLGESKDKKDHTNKYNWKNKVVLVVEDEEVNFKFIEAILSDTQAQLLHAHNGKQAIELCQSIHKIDLILMDIRMPEMNGYDALKEIKKMKNIPVVAQSAFAMSDIKNNSLNMGFDDYITKPIDIKSFLSKINRYLE